MQTTAINDSQPPVRGITTIPPETSIPPKLGTTTAACKLTYLVGLPAKSMAEVVKGNRMKDQGMQLKLYPLVIKDGVKLVELNQNEVERQCQKWNSVATPKVLLHGDGYFIFKFESIEDKNMIIQNGPYTFNNRPMILKDWTPDFNIRNESLRLVPIWVIVPGLPIQFWAEENLGRLVSYIEQPLCTDKLTAHYDRVSYARVLIEVDVTQPLPDVLPVIMADGNIWNQDVEYELKPMFCQECNQFGHTTEKYRRKQPQVQPEKNQNKKKKKEKWEWKTKAVEPSDTVETTSVAPENTKSPEIPSVDKTAEETQEVQIQIHLSNRGKQVVVHHRSKKKGGHHIDIQDIARRNQFAPLRILERAQPEQDQTIIRVEQLTYAGVEAVYLLPRDSDHSPIMLNTVVSSSKVRRPFRP
ncbi:hypothetical protein A4A49_03017 [Nicotiana attenuata]|uniref:DUF4283 domain-containing protein n=1 Tax=Nicotiana attenuata TaxID=49451 RepID=A0A314L1X8_NICAT|nr:hypothetical protein A4A49_03017 [Nicotiana attenuata]